MQASRTRCHCSKNRNWASLCSWISRAQRTDHLATVCLLHGHEQRELVEPVRTRVTEALEPLTQRAAAGRNEPLEYSWPPRLSVFVYRRVEKHAARSAKRHA
jgi:hypothetical protein